MNYIIILLNAILFSACTSATQYQFINKIGLGDVSPIGIAYHKGSMWLADGNNNRILEMYIDGNLKKEYTGFDRPMHLDANEDGVFIPQYGNDIITQLKDDERSNLSLFLNDSLDAPASISVFKNEKAIADFYNHRIVYYNGNEWISFGKEGKTEGLFYYPTDVQITQHKIYVADAYNNRVQVFDKQGQFLLTFGKAEKINAATGIYVSETEVWVTDFENDRLLIYDLAGKLLQIIEEGLSRPTDAVLINKALYVTNFKGKYVSVFKK